MPEQIVIQKGEKKDSTKKTIKAARGSPISPAIGDTMRLVGSVSLSRNEQGHRRTYPK